MRVLLMLGLICAFAACNLTARFRQPTPAFSIRAATINLPFHIGVFEDAGILSGDSIKFRAMIDDLQTRGLDAVMFDNNFAERDAALLQISDERRLDVYMLPGGDLNETWWPASVPANIETARKAAKPIIDQWSLHSSFTGYITKDEPGLHELDKVRLITQAFRELDPTRPNMPILIGIDRVGPIFGDAQPDVLLIDVYPVGYQSALCDFSMTGFGYPFLDFVSYIRTVTLSKPASTPLWVILQTHSFQKSLREPSPVEVRLQYWLAIGEGAKGIFWFIYSSQQGWRGLVDNPSLFSEVTTLTQRTKPALNLLLHLQKVEDKFTATATGDAKPYVSTLSSSEKQLYVVAVNRDCQHSQSLSINLPEVKGHLRDLETSRTYNLGKPISFAPGDGKIFGFAEGSTWPIFLPIVR